MATDLTSLEELASQLALDLNSTVMLAGSEGMSQALPVCQNIKFLAQQSQPGTLFEQLLSGAILWRVEATEQVARKTARKA